MVASSPSSDDFIQQLNQLITATSQSTSEDQDSSVNLSEPCSSLSNPTATIDTRKQRSGILQSPSERCKYIKDTMDEVIEMHRKGIC